MVNDYLWTQLYAQRQSELRARARRRGGEYTATGGTRRALAAWLRLHAGRYRAAAEPAAGTSGVLADRTVASRAVGRRTASDAPTTSARAWARLANGTGSLDPAPASTTASAKDAA